MDLGRLDINGRVAGDRVEYYNAHLFRDFCARNEGKLFTGSINVYQDLPSAKLMGYYWGEVIPKIQNGLRELGYNMTRRQTSDYVKQFTVIGREELINFDCVEVVDRSLSDINWTNDQRRYYINELVRFAHSELGVQIEEPRKIKEP